MEILKFQAKVCAPCKFVNRIIKELGVEVDKEIDIEDDVETRERYNVMKSPTVLLIDDDGNEVDRAIGIDKEKIVSIFKQAGKL